MCLLRHTGRFRLLPICILVVSGCASFRPRPGEEVLFRGRSQTQTEGNVRVTAAVPTAKESSRLFGVSLYNDGIQPIWLEIENKDEEGVWFLPVGLDPDYFTPLEAAYLNHIGAADVDQRMNRYFRERGMGGLYIGPGRTRSGYVFTPVDEGTKEFNVDLLEKDHQLRTLTFFINVPGLKVDHHKVDFEALYTDDEITTYDEDHLREALAALPCCTTNKGGTIAGDPLNLVVIGEAEDVFYAFIRSGWDETETVYRASAWKTAMSFLFGGRYRYAPVSSLYALGRNQDIALQKTRDTVHKRNHLRLWRAPMRLGDKPVWIGQISRDIGVRWTRKTILTHRIDPDVDETRDFLVQDLWYAQGLAQYAYVKGVGAAPLSAPRTNLTGDPYFTDGLRAVLWVSSQPVGLDETWFLEWERPPER